MPEADAALVSMPQVEFSVLVACGLVYGPADNAAASTTEEICLIHFNLSDSIL